MSNSQKYPPDWTTQILAEACDISIGGTPSRDQDSFWAQGEDGYPWVAISDMGPKLITKTNERITKAGVVNSNAKSVRAGTTLMSFKLTLGRMGIAGIDLYTNEAIAAFVPKSEDVNSKWLYHFLPGLVTSVTAEQAIKGQTLNKKKLNGLTIYLPSPNEQRRIAEILDTIDEAIQKTEALILKLKTIKQGLLHDVLTRGLDKNGKLRDPKAHPEQFKNSPLGRIPKEWVIQELGKAAPKIQDGTHFSPKTTSGPFRYLTSKNIRFGHVDLSDCGWISKKEHEAIYSRCDVRYGDVLLTKDGANTGNAAINNLNEPVSLLSSVAFIRCDDRILHSEYVFHYLLSPGCQQRIKDLMSGNAITRLTLERIKSFAIPVPDIKEQLKIVEPLNSHDARIRTEEQYRDKLKLQKKGLMHDLLTGKVRVKT